MSAFERRSFLFLKSVASTLETRRSYSSLLSGWLIMLAAVSLLHLEANGIHVRDGALLRDSFAPMEDLWRALNGQTAGIDYSSTTSPVSRAILVAAAHLAGPRPDLARFVSPFLALLLGPAILWQAWRRLPSGEAFLLVCAFTLAAVAARPLAGNPLDFAFPDIAVGIKWLLMLPPCLGLFRLRLDARHRKPVLFIAESCLMASSAAILSLIDPASGLSSFILLLAGVAILPPEERRRAAGTLAGSIVLLIVLSEISPEAIASWGLAILDQALTQGLPNAISAKFRSIYSNAIVVSLAGVIGIWILEQYRQDFHDDGGLARAVSTAIVLMIVSALSVPPAPNDYPLLLLVLLVYLHRAAVTIPVSMTGIQYDAYRVLRYAISAMPFLLLSTWLIAIQAFNIAAHTANSAASPAGNWDSSVPHIADLKPSTDDVATTPGINNVGYAAAIREAIGLLREHGRDHTRIMLLDEVNPLPYLLRSEPPRTLLGRISIGGTFSASSPPPASRFFGNTETLIIPREGLFGSTADILSGLYADAISSCFSQATGSIHFEIWTRQPSCRFDETTSPAHSTDGSAHGENR